MNLKGQLFLSGVVQMAIGMLFVFIIPLSNIEIFNFLKEFRVEGQPGLAQFFASIIIFFSILSLKAAKNPEKFETFIFWDAIWHLTLFIPWGYGLFFVGIESIVISTIFWILLIADPIWGIQTLYLLKKK